MRIRDAIRKQPVTIDAAATVRHAAELMDRSVVGALVVIDNDRAVGIVTDRDIVTRGVARHVESDARIDALMSPDPFTIDADADLREALRIFRSHAFRRLPVLHDATLVGMITVDDLMVDITADLADLTRPVTGQVIFGHAEAAPPATVS